jgi:hypothetical protein
MKCSIVLVLAGLIWTSEAQVPNNSISNRLHLGVEGPVLTSSTANASVEWECINKSLTNKCLIYHNDQWFDFSVPSIGKYYLNVSSQSCKERRGVQMVIIEGNPCEIKTYKILACLSQVRQDDVFVALDSLRPGMLYLVNIDGFLGDQCDFKLQLSRNPAGLPLKAEGTVPGTSQQSPHIKIRWHVSRDSIDGFEKFIVYKRRKSEPKAVKLEEQTILFNAYGSPLLHYETSDSLKAEGTYTYLVYGVGKMTLVPTLLAQREINYKAPRRDLTTVRAQRTISIKTIFPEKTIFELMVFDNRTGTTLLRSKREFDLTGETIKVDVGEFLDRGVTSFLILLSDPNTREPREFYYHVGINGQLIKE